MRITIESTFQCSPNSHFSFPSALREVTILVCAENRDFGLCNYERFQCRSSQLRCRDKNVNELLDNKVGLQAGPPPVCPGLDGICRGGMVVASLQELWTQVNCLYTIRSTPNSANITHGGSFNNTQFMLSWLAGSWRLQLVCFATNDIATFIENIILLQHWPLSGGG